MEKIVAVQLLKNVSFCSDCSVADLWKVRERKITGMINTAQFLALIKVCKLKV